MRAIAQRMTQGIDRLVQGFALGLVALALLLRAAVPAGWMPTQGDGAFIISLCTDQGLVSVPAGDGHSMPSNSADPCAFAGLGAAFLAAAPCCMLPLVWAFFAAPPLTRAALLPGRGLAAPPPPATGPPAHLKSAA